MLATRVRDLAIKYLIKSQSRALATKKFPRLAVVPAEHVGLAVCATGLYEADEIALVRDLILQKNLAGTVLLDIGANLGNHTCALAPHFTRVVSFEPNPPIAALLRANVLLNGLGNVSIHEVGLAVTDAELSFGLGEQGNDGSGSFAVGGEHTLPVRNGDVTLGRILAAPEFKGLRIGFIKCDVQGFEALVFEGLSSILSAHRPLVMFESESLEEGKDSWARLQAAGYRQLERIRTPGDDVSNKWRRELTHLMQGRKCWLEPLTHLPSGHCNLVAS